MRGSSHQVGAGASHVPPGGTMPARVACSRPLIALARFLILAPGLILIDSNRAEARSNHSARIALHLTSVTSKNACARPQAKPSCSFTVTSGDLSPATYFAYLLVQEGDPSDGIGGLQCGLSYNGAAGAGVDVFGWTSCATLEFPSGGWPGNGSGNLITWDVTNACQRTEPGGGGSGVVATAGYFYLAAYSPDVLEITPRPVDGSAKVADCSGREYTLEGNGVHHDPSYLGRAAFSAGGVTPGYNPCTAPAMEPPDCTISGPNQVNSGTTGTGYTASLAPTTATYFWSINGNGTIAGSNTARTVLVNAGAPGTFGLSVEVTDGGLASTCSRTITVAVPPPPTCSINGPISVGEGTVGNAYTSVATGVVTARSWSITGNGTITTATNLATIEVTAGLAGSYHLTCLSTYSGGTQSSCELTVDVIPATCGIIGPDPVIPGASGVVYAAAATPTEAMYLWSISGNGSIPGSTTGSTVQVSVGTPGSFTLELEFTYAGTTVNCSRTITVGGGGGAHSEAALVLHALPVPTGSSCNRPEASAACQDVNYNNLALAPTTHYVYLLVQGGNVAAGVGGLQFGIDYDPAPGSGVDVFLAANCASLEFPSTGWPAPGGGNLITWDTSTRCQRFVPPGNDPLNGVIAVAGWFFVAAYSPDRLILTPRPVDGQAKISDCASNETLIGGTGYPVGAPNRLGAAAFGRSDGRLPCGVATPVQQTSWGTIKALYGTPGGRSPRRP